VQILLGLVRPFQILLLDEITTSLDVCVRQDLLRWLVKESDERGATVIYATHIFDGLESWGTHLFYLTDSGQCGWQGRPQDLDYFKQLQAENHPAKMLAVAENWLRKELEANRLLRKRERPMGDAASSSLAEMTGRSQGGYGSGRMVTDAELAEKMKRQGRLSDIMGNAGTMSKVHRTAGN
jgi:CCR4-NOT complex subunit CAF16